MLFCGLCYWMTELDDVVVRVGRDACVCLRCHGRETRTHRSMPRPLRRLLQDVLGEPDTAQ
jgi:hypothetical protein